MLNPKKMVGAYVYMKISEYPLDTDPLFRSLLIGFPPED